MGMPMFKTVKTVWEGDAWEILNETIDISIIVIFNYYYYETHWTEGG